MGSGEGKQTTAPGPIQAPIRGRDLGAHEDSGRKKDQGTSPQAFVLVEQPTGNEDTPKSHGKTGLEPE
jgi:hypothetical protein